MRLNLQPDQATQDKLATEADAVLAALKNSRPAQIDAWIDANVNSLAAAKLVLKALAKIAILQLRGKL